ncbi:hypothetical protein YASMINEVIRUS_207 [Yasminevirus sp. GU-2018]|uniref:Nudix hydrolase domain-containing protein n=1 Tax=Yasminevirus sp. GU-2018 TaxID=2420051 RepID=A0A5K0U8C3_9VIRU|nr:hypothetical protein YASMINEVIRUS_207 [Yasminevirus sp. GU-2018]
MSRLPTDNPKKMNISVSRLKLPTEASKTSVKNQSSRLMQSLSSASGSSDRQKHAKHGSPSHLDPDSVSRLVSKITSDPDVDEPAFDKLAQRISVIDLKQEPLLATLTNATPITVPTPAPVPTPVPVPVLSPLPDLDVDKRANPSADPVHDVVEPLVELKEESKEDSKEDAVDESALLLQDALRTVRANQAVTRVFKTNVISVAQPVKASYCTYWGMLESLRELKTIADNANMTDVCVLCPRYDVNMPSGGDTQAGGGGKACMWFDRSLRRTVRERPIDAVREEVAEELRLETKVLTQMSSFQTTVRNRKGYNEDTFTDVFAIRVSDCTPIKNFDPRVYGKKGRRGDDDYFSRVGFIPWGTLEECLSMLVAMEVSMRPSELVDDIDAISIVSLDCAIRMASDAARNLKGSVKLRKIF